MDVAHTDIYTRETGSLISGKAAYFVVLLDYSTGMSSIYFLKQKSEVLSALRTHKSMVESRNAKKMLSLRLDRAREQATMNFKAFAQENGISLKYSAVFAIHSNRSPKDLIQERYKLQ